MYMKNFWDFSKRMVGAKNPLIEDLKTKHPDWTITFVTSDEAAKRIKKQSK